MEPHIFKTDTNLTDVDTITAFKSNFIYGNTFGNGSIHTYSRDSSSLSLFLVFLALPVLFYITVIILSTLKKVTGGEKIESEEAGIIVLALVGIIAVLVFSVAVKPGPEGKFGMESVLAYYDKDKASVEDIQGSWLYKNRDFVQENVKNSSYIKNYEIHCDDELKISEQEKRSVLCGGDILSPVSAQNKDSGVNYWLLPDFRIDHGLRDDPRIAKLKEQEKDKENPIKLSMIVEEESV